MKSFWILLFAVVVTMLGAGILFAAHHDASVEKGKALFNDPKLGTSGQSCGTCHPNGKGLEKSAAKIKNLEDAVNNCITKPLKGKALDVKSSDMQSIVMYIKSLKPASGGY